MNSLLLSGILLANLITPSVPVWDTEEVLAQLAFCESSNRQNIIRKNDGIGDSYSYLQFKLETFRHFGERYGLPHDDIFSKEQQFAIAGRMLSEGRFSHWSVCSRKLKLKERYELSKY